MLHPDDAAAGLNFTSAAAKRLFANRRLEGWGVDPVRCTSHLTSSQALTLNLFGPLTEDPVWFREVLASVLARADIASVNELKVEFAPPRPSTHLNDKTRVDAFAAIRSAAGGEFVVVETKYADRFNSRRVDVATDRYRQVGLAARLWTSHQAALEALEVNQLVRCDALGASVGLQCGVTRPPIVLVIHHERDQKAIDAVRTYRGLVRDPSRVKGVTLRALSEVMAATAPQRFVSSTRLFQSRYVDESLSQPCWDGHPGGTVPSECGSKLDGGQAPALDFSTGDRRGATEVSAQRHIVQAP